MFYYYFGAIWFLLFNILGVVNGVKLSAPLMILILLISGGMVTLGMFKEDRNN